MLNIEKKDDLLTQIKITVENFYILNFLAYLQLKIMSSIQTDDVNISPIRANQITNVQRLVNQQ